MGMRPIELALYAESMQRVSECESMVFCGAAARLRRAAAPC
jgi:hypothetical protein